MKKDKILNNMMSKLPVDYDKSEGGLFFDTLSPISHELEKAYKYVEYRFKNAFPETSEGEFLDLHVREENIERRQATKSVGIVTIRGVNGTIVRVGTIVATDSYLFETTEERTLIGGQTKVPVQSIKSGSIYNIPAGTINNFPMTIQGLESVTNEQPFVDGYDMEDDKSLFERYLTKIREPQTSGNEYDYKKWALEVEGVGNARVFGLWNGNGTVKVAIIGNDNLPANTELVERAEQHISNFRPIGANVTVVSADTLDLNIIVSIKVNSKFTREQAENEMTKSISDFIRSLAFNEDIVSFAKLGFHILKLDAITDYKNLTINNSQENINIPKTAIAVLKKLQVNFYEV